MQQSAGFTSCGSFKVKSATVKWIDVKDAVNPYYIGVLT